MADDRLNNPSQPRLCKLEQALGNLRRCPEERCAFWEAGDGGRTGGCVLDELDLAGRRDVARWLTDFRAELERNPLPPLSTSETPPGLL